MNLDLKEIWTNINEEYSIRTSKTQYDITLNKIKKKEALRNKLVTLYSCLLLMKIGATRHQDLINSVFLQFGYPKNIGVDALERRINRESSYLKLLDSESKQQDEPIEINFWHSVSLLESISNMQIDIEKVSLARWIEMVKVQKNKANYNGNKRTN